MLRGLYTLTFSLQTAWYLFAAAGYLLSKREMVTPILVADEGKRAA